MNHILLNNSFCRTLYRHVTVLCTESAIRFSTWTFPVLSRPISSALSPTPNLFSLSCYLRDKRLVVESLCPARDAPNIVYSTSRTCIALQCAAYVRYDLYKVKLSTPVLVFANIETFSSGILILLRDSSINDLTQGAADLSDQLHLYILYGWHD